jgi:hypothetical protein
MLARRQYHTRTKQVSDGLQDHRSTQDASRASFDRFANPRQLSEMQQIVAGVQADHVFDTLFSALCVHADASKIFRRSTPQQAEIRAPQDRELIQRLVDRRVVVVKALRPQVLVVAGERRTVLREHHADAVSPHQIRVGQMLHDLAD